MMTNLTFINSKQFEDRKFAVLLERRRCLKTFNYHYLRKQQDVCLSRQLVSPT